ncbi:HNH endonuclease [Dyella mobilis]|uniref:HNH endonuclease n=1 Tax=Dyella mobilis TaxID=1849582 RepID=UPI0034E29DD0
MLHSATGHCERCQRPAPFRRKTVHTPYLEVHHKVWLAHGGQDTVENAEALCPTVTVSNTMMVSRSAHSI